MPYFSSSEEWQRQSCLLIRAQPSTTHITTKYNIPNLNSKRHVKKQRLRAVKRQEANGTGPAHDEPAKEQTDAAPKTPKATFELKTFDPVTGVTLKYRTDKAAEVGRLIAATGRLARDMVGLPDEDPSAMVTSAASDARDTAAADVVVGDVEATVDKVKTVAPGAAEPGNKKKKKKGKK